MDAIILAGGRGLRMEDELPKALVSVKGKPLIAHQLDYLMRFREINSIVLAIGYEAEKIVDFVNKNYQQKNILFSIETKPLGTAGAIGLALKKIFSEKVLVLNGDCLADIDLRELEKCNESCICVNHPVSPFGKVVEKEGYAVFVEKPILEDWTSCGWYLLKRSDLSKVVPVQGSLEYDILPSMKLRLYKHYGFKKSFDTKKDILDFEKI